ncbi:divalent cation tolerance protein CutA [Catellatospora tritici]|uniref:divalent cation tolerance protein CutA n=1 Tax=Catellatospora tritici TaxID=2851566 RepID=UPI003558BE52
MPKQFRRPRRPPGSRAPHAWPGRRRPSAARHTRPTAGRPGRQCEIHDQTEARVALHTRRVLVPQIAAATQRDHAYAVLCVITLLIIGGNPDCSSYLPSFTRCATFRYHLICHGLGL